MYPLEQNALAFTGWANTFPVQQLHKDTFVAAYINKEYARKNVVLLGRDRHGSKGIKF